MYRVSTLAFLALLRITFTGTASTIPADYKVFGTVSAQRATQDDLFGPVGLMRKPMEVYTRFRQRYRLWIQCI